MCPSIPSYNLSDIHDEESRIPAGWYVCKVAKCDKKQSKGANGPKRWMLEWTLKPISKSPAGRPVVGNLKTWTMLEGDFLTPLKEMALALGATKTFGGNTDVFIGKRLIAVVSTTQRRNRIDTEDVDVPQLSGVLPVTEENMLLLRQKNAQFLEATQSVEGEEGEAADDTETAEEQPVEAGDDEGAVADDDNFVEEEQPAPAPKRSAVPTQVKPSPQVHKAPVTRRI